MAAQAAMKTEHDTYDQMPYESYAYPHTHPAHLSVIATLFGLSPTDFRKANVLELGCASGGNIFSQALLYPESNYLGIDLSAEQIAQANAAKDAMGVKNVEFQQMDITKFDLKKYKGKFDYIICHGVFSWVPDAVRESILKLCQDTMTENGIAIVSYNTLPGWNAVRSIREMMLYHTNRFENPAEKVAQAKALLKFLGENVSAGRASYRAAIDEELAMLEKVNDSYLFHDHLEHTNAQFYFHEFMDMAHKNGLSYVGDTALPSMFVGNMPQGALEALKAVNDIVGQEQYMDFVNNRRFRNSILCKNSQKIVRNLKEAQIMDFHISAIMKPEDDNRTAPVKFTMGGGAHFTANDEQSAMLFTVLTEQGARPIAARELVAEAGKRLKMKDTKALEAILVQFGLKLALHGYIQLHLEGVPAATTISAKPEVFAFARYQAVQPGAKSVTSMNHALVGTDAPGCLLMSMADGTRTQAQLVDEMTKAAMDGRLTLRQGETPITDEATIRQNMEGIVAQVLEKLKQQNLLVA